MRYPCADGIDRDIYIEQYLKLERELHQVMEGLGVLAERKKRLHEELDLLMEGMLGDIGMEAMRARPAP